MFGNLFSKEVMPLLLLCMCEVVCGRRTIRIILRLELTSLIYIFGNIFTSIIEVCMGK